MTVQVRVASVADYQRWNVFVGSHPEGNIFQTTYMSMVLGRLSSKPFLVVAEDRGEIVGGLLSNVVLGNSKIAPLRLFAEIRSNYGPLFREEYDGLGAEIVRFAAKKMGDMGYLSHYFVGFGDYSKVLVDLGYGKAWSVSVASVVDLRRSEDELFKSFSSDHRRGVRKAEKAGLRVEVMSDPSSPRVYHNILADQARRLQIRPEPYSFIKAIWDILRPRGMARFYCAYYGEKPVAALIVLNYNRVAHAFLGCALGEYLKYYPWNIIHWRAMRDMMKEGYEQYDLMLSPAPEQTSHPHYGLYLFKHGFGAKTVPLCVYIRRPRGVRTVIWDRVVVRAFKRLPSLSRLV